jgi:ubiquitin-conjugating enzyme E2 W
MASISARRLGKELTEIRNEGCPVGKCYQLCTFISLDLGCSFFCDEGINLVQADDFLTWLFTIEVMGESLYPVSDNITSACSTVGN